MVQGEAGDVARDLVAELRAASDGPRPACVIYAGETTVTVGEAAGAGGRNQELALAAAIELEGLPDAAVVALATDGVDGPTDAAGAVVTTATAAALRDAGVDPGKALAEHDSHTALDRVGALIRTGPTGTNINDVAVAILF
jgi:glycerate-2-kinase